MVSQITNTILNYMWVWCAPSRGALLSGKHPNLSGFTQSVDSGHADGTPNATTTALHTRYVLLPALLRRAGYATRECMPLSFLPRRCLL